jgi:hypothetical protein
VSELIDTPHKSGPTECDRINAAHEELLGDKRKRNYIPTMTDEEFDAGIKAIIGMTYDEMLDLPSAECDEKYKIVRKEWFGK